MVEEKKRENLKKILGDLYMKSGLTDEVVRLSQCLDEEMVKIQRARYKLHKDMAENKCLMNVI